MKKNKINDKKNSLGLAALTGIVSGTTRAIIDYFLEKFMD